MNKKIDMNEKKEKFDKKAKDAMQFIKHSKKLLAFAIPATASVVIGTTKIIRGISKNKQVEQNAEVEN